MSDPDLEEPGRAPATRARWLRTERVLLLIALGVIVWEVGYVLWVVFAGVLIGVALDGFTRLTARLLPIKRGWAFVVVVVLVAASAVAGVTTIVAPLVDQLRQLWQDLPVFADRAATLLSEQVGLELDLASREAQDGLLAELTRRAAQESLVALNVIVSVVIALALGAMLALNPRMYQRGVLQLVPARRRARVAEVMAAAGRALRWWLIGQSVSMAILGTVTSVTLWALDIPLWLGLGLLTAMLTFIPYFGPLIAAVPVLVISFGEGIETGVTVFVIYVILQNLEGFVITPAIQQRAVRLPPALLITTQVVIGAMFGAPGLILAAPFTAVAMVAVKMLYVEDVVGPLTPAAHERVARAAGATTAEASAPP
jgi:predicted PurR-regulated permease PerM